MRKIIVSEFITLDGIIEAPDKWSLRFWNDEIAKFKFDELFAGGALLLGRITYQGFAAAWPSRTDEEGYADRMNSLPKFVVSTTLAKAEWNNSTLLKNNIAAEISKLKQQPGQNILVFGSGGLIQTLKSHHLIDEYRLLVYPVVWGGGKRLFQNGDNMQILKLIEAKAFSSGVVALSYELAKKKLGG